jgi:hypothetical protein
MTNVRRLLVPFASLVVACSSATADTTPRLGVTKEPDLIGSNENPAVIIPGASSLLSDNLVATDVGQTYGTDDAHVPYPDTYWPFTSGGIDEPWLTSTTPLDKYMALFDSAGSSAAKAWERANHGPGVPGVQGWYGHCPGWTGAATSLAPLQHSISVSADSTGGLHACDANAAGCTTLEIGDINALEAEVYNDGPAAFIGARCDTPPQSIKRDTYGRIVRDGTGCQGLNAGALVIVLGQMMKRLHQPLAIDAQNDFNTDQIWNQPAFRYTVYSYAPLTMVEAANYVATGSPSGALTTYPWDAEAAGFVRVDIGIHWVSEHGPNSSVVSGLESADETRFAAVIELDGDPAAAGTRIIGGEYIDDPSVGADRLTVAPFVWAAHGPGPESLPTSVGGSSHNPYVQPSKVLALVTLAQGGGE